MLCFYMKDFRQANGFGQLNSQPGTDHVSKCIRKKYLYAGITGAGEL